VNVHFIVACTMYIIEVKYNSERLDEESESVCKKNRNTKQLVSKITFLWL
jgi:hypothetical protein